MDIKKGRPLLEKGKGRILVVEDEVTNQKLIGNILKTSGYSVEIAPDGIIALMQIFKEKFDLILSDIAMPNLDGYQMLDYLRNNNIDIPVIFISSHSGAEYEAKGLQMGASEYIKKPVDPKLLLIKIEKVLNSHH
jgi:CheY-like chemotaxis protein